MKKDTKATVKVGLMFVLVIATLVGALFGLDVDFAIKETPNDGLIETPVEDTNDKGDENLGETPDADKPVEGEDKVPNDVEQEQTPSETPENEVVEDVVPTPDNTPEVPKEDEGAVEDNGDDVVDQTPPADTETDNDVAEMPNEDAPQDTAPTEDEEVAEESDKVNVTEPSDEQQEETVTEGEETENA